ncbi:cytochrome P450 [Streptomyces beigongshangae]|uniref:cytochrome P450 n=1 Tax=Streptomyces beigongshangae TaxID=2841597 RepID=UPI001C859A34|nr:cytochrome P450 [Streptomyces sp. REN17]
MTRDPLPDFAPSALRDIADPYPDYRRYREGDPVHRVAASGAGGTGTWYVFRHDDVSRVLRGRDFGHDARRAAEEGNRPVVPARHGVLRSMVEDWLVFMDPPRHTRVRAVLAGAFSGDAVAGLRTRVDEITTDLLGGLAHRSSVDLVDAFAAPLPVLVVSHVLGVDERHHTWLRECATAVQEASTSRGGRAPGAYAAAESAAAELCAFFRRELALRRTGPRDDLLTVLGRACGADGPLTEDEAVASCVHLLTAGHETTTNLISKAALALLAHPSVLADLAAHPGQMPYAVNEFIRYDAPVQMASRWVYREVVLGGHRIRPGDKVLLVLGSANRDPRHCPDPDTLDIRRPAARHLGFGLGRHYCLGAGLATLEAEIALGALIGVLPRFRLAGAGVTYARDLVFHGPSRLVVEARPFQRSWARTTREPPDRAGTMDP